MYEIIENLCTKKGVTITQMCRDANVPRGNLTDLKKGRQSGLSAKNLQKIADYFDVSIGYLLGSEETKKSTSIFEGGNKQYEELFKIVAQLSKEECDRLISYGQGIVDGNK